MAILSIITCIVACSLYVLTSKRMILRPGFVFCVIFMLIQIASSVRFFGLIQCSDKVYTLCLISVTFFLLGTLFSQKLNFKKIVTFRTNTINYRLVYAFMCITALIMIPYIINMTQILMRYGNEGFLIIRRALINKDGDLFNNTSSRLLVLYELIINPLCYAMPAICAVDWVHGKKNKIIIFFTVFIVAFKTIFNFNRATIFYAGMIIILVLIMNGRRLRLSKKQKLGVFALSAVILFIIYQITITRTDENIIKSMYLYVAGALPNLDLRLDRIDSSGIIGGGFAALKGIYYLPANVIFSFLGIKTPEWMVAIDTMTYAQVEDFLYIGPGMIMNAFVTPIYSMYLDGRYIGLALEMMLYGFFAEKCFMNSTKQHNTRNDAVYSLILIGLIFSFVRMQFSDYAYTWGIILTMMMTTNVKIRR